ncbi:hypothetical protein KIH31_16015 [Paenarthrobacter sp. DKR-5]|uniref:hypothetical protein n=1 Tax=Paenarthrobacter sp. DKR-5 TaxID=2835535 RepID=UPI001BDD6F07|nr:hypothetical protein [Paenarthrobacter sp. DKR-5]MBT1004093.1 hypothetical protein [Paenarthrobacter sp. DKR-5]
MGRHSADTEPDARSGAAGSEVVSGAANDAADGDPIIAQAVDQDTAAAQVPDLQGAESSAPAAAPGGAAGPAEELDKKTPDDRGLTTNTDSSE